ncbi:MAG: riboflavin synthase [Planctomycetota bacterium]|jgi:riboflavin synthase
MFTGLVEGMGTVEARCSAEAGEQLWVDLGPLAEGLALGDSVCTSGACLSVAAQEGSQVRFDVSPESLSKTTLGSLVNGSKVNVERSLRVGDRLGGHFLSGHVDGLGSFVGREQQGDFALFTFRSSPGFWPFLVSKGSVGIEGVSLTVAELVEDFRFTVALIPETLHRTTLGALQPGDSVNLEGDLLGKYVLRFLAQKTENPHGLQEALGNLGNPDSPLS